MSIFLRVLTGFFIFRMLLAGPHCEASSHPDIQATRTFRKDIPFADALLY